MDRKLVPLVAVTGFWAVVGIIFPILTQFFMRGSPNKGIVQLMMMMTAACCYLFWLCAFLFQLNPLLGPDLETGLIRVMMYEWGNK
ncbi:V-type proton ATPase subunit e [Mizuhopecten yessoensis]|uniref:V-type proton ATPase subunit e n=1 Tax=Mizuhopecten yessoensis TaxID=6573 RepID=A0A210PUS2_MIZYE|nr:V-type proton ATPase subunit e [Mizuhopecten yessoensis]